MSSQQPDKRTEAQVVKDLGLAVGDSVMCTDNVSRTIRKISSSGEVFVWGVRAKINVYALKPTAN